MIVSLYVDYIATIVVYGGVLLSMAGDVMHTGCRWPALAGRIPVPYWATLEVGFPPVFPLQLQEREDHISRIARNKMPLGQGALYSDSVTSRSSRPAAALASARRLEEALAVTRSPPATLAATVKSGE